MLYSITLTVLVDNQLDAQFFYNIFIYFSSVHVSSTFVLILRKTIVWIQLLVKSVCLNGRPLWRSRWRVPSRPAYWMATNTEWLYQKLYSYNCPPEDEHKGAQNMYRIEINKYIIKKNCASSWLSTKIIRRCTIRKILNFTLTVSDRSTNYVFPPTPTPVNWLVCIPLHETTLLPYPDLYIHPDQLYQLFFWHKHEGTNKKSWKISKFLPFVTVQ